MRESNLRERNAFSESTIGADDAERRIARALGICVGNYLREMYSDRLKEPIPPKLADLLRRLDAGCSIPTSDRSLHLSRNSNPALGDWARRTMMCGIGIGVSLAAAPSHTTVHTGPYTAVRWMKAPGAPRQRRA